MFGAALIPACLLGAVDVFRESERKTERSRTANTCDVVGVEFP